MTSALFLTAVIVGIAALYFILAPLIRTYARYRGARVVTCPENNKPAGVQIDAIQAALSRDVQLKQCSRWPERQSCGQECLKQIAAAPDGCLVRNMLAAWYAGKKCVFCGKPLEDVDWAEHRPALMSPDKKTVEWSDLPPERVPEALATYMPVCWNCHIAVTFRNEHPELITERPWPRR